MSAFSEIVGEVSGIQFRDERLGGLARSGGLGSPGGFAGREFGEGGDPGLQILFNVDRLRHVVFVEVGLVTGNGLNGEYVARAGLGFGEAAGVGGDNGKAAEHGLHCDQPEAFVPKRRHEQEAGLGQDVFDVGNGFEDGDVGQGREKVAIGGGGAPTSEGGEFEMGQAPSEAGEDGDPLDDARVDHQNVAVVKAAEMLPRGLAIDGRMDDDGLDAEVLFDVGGHVVADDDDAAGLFDERRGGGVRVPAFGAEGEELGRMRDENQPPRSNAKSFAEEDVAQVFGRDEDPIGFEPLDFSGEVMDVAGELWNTEDGDAAASGFARFVVRRADDADLMTGGDEGFEPDEIAARGTAAGRFVRGVGG